MANKTVVSTAIMDITEEQIEQWLDLPCTKLLLVALKLRRINAVLSLHGAPSWDAYQHASGWHDACADLCTVWDIMKTMKGDLAETLERSPERRMYLAALNAEVGDDLMAMRKAQSNADAAEEQPPWEQA